MGWGGKRCSHPGCPPDPPPPLPAGYSISSFLQMLHPECKELPEPHLLPGQLSHGAVGVKDGRVQWISMAFESVSPGRPPGAGGALASQSALSSLVPTPTPEQSRGVALWRGS